MSPDDPGLSTEERIRRSLLCWAEVSFADLSPAAEAHKNAFYMVACPNTIVHDVKKKIVCTKINGKYVSDVFERCLVAHVLNCQESMKQFHEQHGKGMRSAERSVEGSAGYLALLLLLA